MRSEESEASPMPAVVVRRVGQDLRLDDADNNQVVLENYFAVCKDSSMRADFGPRRALMLLSSPTLLRLWPCWVTARPCSMSRVGQEALAAIVSGNSSLRLAMAEPAGQTGLMTAQSGVNAQDSFAQWVPAAPQCKCSGACWPS